MQDVSSNKLLVRIVVIDTTLQRVRPPSSGIMEVVAKLGLPEIVSAYSPVLHSGIVQSSPQRLVRR